MLGKVTINTAKVELTGIILHPYGNPVTQLSWATADNFFKQAHDILNQIHALGYLHRDIKPQNFIWVGDNLHLNDFDLATTVGEASNVGFIGGTPKYSSPLLDGAHRYSVGDDIISLVLSTVDLVAPNLLESNSTISKLKVLDGVLRGTIGTKMLTETFSDELSLQTRIQLGEKIRLIQIH